MVEESNQNVFLIQIDASSSQNSNYPSSGYRDSTVVLRQILTSKVLWGKGVVTLYHSFEFNGSSNNQENKIAPIPLFCFQRTIG